MSNQRQLEHQPLAFQTQLHHLMDANLVYCLPELLAPDEESEETLSPAQLKKAARLELSVRLTSEKVGFLHAALVQIEGKNYLLAGGSGVGKSTYSQALIEHFGGRVLASDWVGVEKDEDQFFVSDLNFADQLKHPDRCPLAGIIFLTKEDYYQRDAFVPNPAEAAALMCQTFDTAAPEQLATLSQFWANNWSELPAILAVPTRQQAQTQVTETLINLVERQKSTYDRVGVIGLGAIGAELANQLGQLEFVNQVNLYNRSTAKATGYALDMNQGVPEKGEVFVAREDAAQVFANSDVVFLCFREANAGTAATGQPERWGKAATHAAIMAEYAKIASEQNFQGTIFVVTNPVDVLSYSLHNQSQAEAHNLKTYQVYGVGLELDKARAAYYAQQAGFDLKLEEIEVFGNHADTFILKTPLSPTDNQQLQELTAQASPAIRQYVPRTVYGPVAAAKQALVALRENRSTTLTVMQNQSYIGRPIQFTGGLPMFGDLADDQLMTEVWEKNRAIATQK